MHEAGVRVWACEGPSEEPRSDCSLLQDCADREREERKASMMRTPETFDTRQRMLRPMSIPHPTSHAACHRTPPQHRREAAAVRPRPSLALRPPPRMDPLHLRPLRRSAAPTAAPAVAAPVAPRRARPVRPSPSPRASLAPRRSPTWCARTKRTPTTSPRSKKKSTSSWPRFSVRVCASSSATLV